ncbi:oxaloacetate decarboxylase subunit beta [Persicobacter psychrovividus]|uniref:Oxaloacetate decarboxylase subunit beta n=2 Tax=Persicobacter psychrovividus TaxID=387638 RepID=A0ABM7VG06_9BACT|nr:oxaloacetate decarboxylase subunit beta [Persicobacter psychrovividus]
MTALGNIIHSPGTLLMLAIGLFLLYLGIYKQYEPLLLVPIAFGVILANSLGGGMAISTAEEIKHLTFLEIASKYGIMNYLYYALIKTGLLPPLIFMGVGALTDFGPMLRNLRLAIFGAAAQMGIFSVLLAALLMGFNLKEAASLGIIGGADGPTAIYTTIKLAPHLLGPIAIAAYSYMALVPVIIPFVVKMTMTEEEIKINMKQMDKRFPPKHPVKNMALMKILFPLFVGGLVAVFVPSSVPLVGMLLFGNLVKEIGANTLRLKEAATGPIMNSATIFLGLTVGATMTADTFLNSKTLSIVGGGFLAFAISIAVGIFAAKLYNVFAQKKINPLIGATGLSAVPMASRVANEISLKYDSRNHILQYCMASNISGVIGSAVAAGVLISFLG